MKKGQVIYTSGKESITVERFLIHTKEEIKQYKKQFPIQYPHVKNLFKRELNAGNIIIVNQKGGWCVESDEIKILQAETI